MSPKSTELPRRYVSRNDKNNLLVIAPPSSVKSFHRTSLTFAAIENMGGIAGILEFGKVIFLAHSLALQNIYKKLYFKFLEDNNYKHKVKKIEN